MTNFIKWDVEKSKEGRKGFYINNGCVVAYAPYHPFCNNKGYVSRSRLIMENHLGRYLDENETIKRLSSNKQDDSLENLKLIKPIYYSWESYEEDVWKTIISYPDYEITNYGKVRSKLTGKVLRGGNNGAGYVCFSLRNNNNIRIERAHRLVIENKIGRRLKTDEVVHHINENKSDNRIENLELMTREEHTSHHSNLRKLVE